MNDTVQQEVEDLRRNVDRLALALKEAEERAATVVERQKFWCNIVIAVAYEVKQHRGVEWVEPWRFAPRAPPKSDPDTLPEGIWSAKKLWEADAMVDEIVRRGISADSVRVVDVIG